MQIDVTNTSILNYHFDNRNTVPVSQDHPVPTVGTVVDDNYGDWLDRFNLQIAWWRFRLGARVDAATYFQTLDRESAQADAQQDAAAAAVLPKPVVIDVNDRSSEY